MNRYTNRFDSKTYEEEEPVAVGYGKPSVPEEWWQENDKDIAWVPETLFVRAQAIASAYNLHLLPTIDIYKRTDLNKKQSETLLDEIDFINKVVNDPLLVEWLDKIKSNALKVVRSSKQIVVII